MSGADVASWVAAVAAAGASVFAGSQLMMLRRQERTARIAEIDGVAVAWHPSTVPTHPDKHGAAVWVYKVEVRNPGRLPVYDVNVTMQFPSAFERLDHDGNPGPRQTVLDVGTAVIFARDGHTWTRRLRMAYEVRSQLRAIRAQVSFLDSAGRRHVNDSTAPRTGDD